MWNWLVTFNFRLRPPYPQRSRSKHLLSRRLDVSQERIWTLWKRELSLAPAGIRSPDCPTHDVVIILTMLYLWDVFISFPMLRYLHETFLGPPTYCDISFSTLVFRNPSWDVLNARMLGCSVIQFFTYNFYWDLLLGLTTYHVLNRSTCIWNLHRWTNSIESKCIKPLITISVTECLSNLLWHSQEIATPRLNDRWPLSKRIYCVLTA